MKETQEYANEEIEIALIGNKIDIEERYNLFNFIKIIFIIF